MKTKPTPPKQLKANIENLYNELNKNWFSYKVQELEDKLKLYNDLKKEQKKRGIK